MPPNPPGSLHNLAIPLAHLGRYHEAVISKRAVTAAAMTATTAVLLASGDAHACSIGDFSAKATCDARHRRGPGRHHDHGQGPLRHAADITVRIRMAVGTDGETMRPGRRRPPTAAGASTTILVPWGPRATNGTSR